MVARPSLRYERELLRCGSVRIAGIDEVGRGAIAGPVAVGVAVVTATTRSAPTGLRDSKLLSPLQREALFPRVRRWATETAVGMSTAQEIDDWGLTAALRLAALRALVQVDPVDAVVLDGSHDYVTRTAETLFDVVPWPAVDVPAVHRVVKGDRRCSSVAAASVVAKVTRDRLMHRMHDDFPDYGWDVNKGYTTPEHSAAVRALGLCEQHRRSWQVAAACAELREHDADAAPSAVIDLASAALDATQDALDIHNPPDTAVVPN